MEIQVRTKEYNFRCGDLVIGDDGKCYLRIKKGNRYDCILLEELFDLAKLLG